MLVAGSTWFLMNEEWATSWAGRRRGRWYRRATGRLQHKRDQKWNSLFVSWKLEILHNMTCTWDSAHMYHTDRKKQHMVNRL
jgi:hypothetical protein